MEDHNHILVDALPDGLMDENHMKVLWNLEHSGYYKIVNDDQVNEGHYESLVPEMDIGPREPDSEYVLTGATLDVPKRVEMYGENIIIDGEKLDETQTQDLMNKIHLNEYKLIPI